MAQYDPRRLHLIAAAAILAAPMVVPIAALGQNPSVNDLIQSLRPTGRGIRPATLPPSDSQAAPSSGAAPAGPHASGPHASAPHGSAPYASAPARHSGQQQAAARPAAPEPPPSANLTVDFRTGSADLTPQAVATLDTLGRALTSQQLNGDKFRIEGHTDTVGSPETNKTLSERRAEAVVNYLVQKFGLAPDKLTAIGMGEDGLLVPTPPQTPELRNRRVVIINEST